MTKAEYYAYHKAKCIVYADEEDVYIESPSGNSITFKVDTFERTTHSKINQLESVITWARSVQDTRLLGSNCIRVGLSVDAMRVAKAISKAEKNL